MDSGNTYCSNCGFDNAASASDKQSRENNKNKMVGIALIVVACVMFVLTFSRVNNEKYNFYKQHYEDCMDGYEESVDMAQINKYRIRAVLTEVRRMEDIQVIIQADTRIVREQMLHQYLIS